MRAGAVAKSGMAPTRGAMKMARKKRMPVVMAVTPVRPPAATPAERFDVAGDGRGAGQGADYGGGGVGEEDFVEAGDGVVGGDETGAFGYGDEGADVVEEVDEEEDEDDLEGVEVEGAADVEVEGGVRGWRGD